VLCEGLKFGNMLQANKHLMRVRRKRRHRRFSAAVSSFMSAATHEYLCFLLAYLKMLAQGSLGLLWGRESEQRTPARCGAGVFSFMRSSVRWRTLLPHAVARGSRDVAAAQPDGHAADRKDDDRSERPYCRFL